MKKVLVTGADGQLGNCLRDASKNFQNIEFTFCNRDALDITNTQSINAFFESNSFDYCINAAAYTNVEKAETEKEQAFLINAEAVKNLSGVCEKNQVVLIQISTDYVFDGEKQIPYLETDNTSPINVYGASKLMGEQFVSEICSKYFIIRTSWLYSQYGHNFFKSILKLSKDKDELKITTEQTGCPTNANDLADAIIKLMDMDKKQYGIYHYSNKGEATWYDFAKTIIDYSKLSDTVNIVETDYYPTFAKRPIYSVLNNSRINSLLNEITKDWKTSLKQLINKIQ